MTLKADDHAAQLPPPPPAIQQSWLAQLERLPLDLKETVTLRPHELRFQRNIARWAMAADGARRQLPTGYVVHAWRHGNDAITVVRTR